MSLSGERGTLKRKLETFSRPMAQQPHSAFHEEVRLNE